MIRMASISTLGVFFGALAQIRFAIMVGGMVGGFRPIAQIMNFFAKVSFLNRKDPVIPEVLSELSSFALN